MTIGIILLAIFYILMPAIILYFCFKYPTLNKLGPVIIAYIIGILLGNTGLLPSMGTFLNEFLVTNPKASPEEIKELLDNGQIVEENLLAFQIYKLRDVLMSVSILLAIPLMLFSSNIKQWKEMAGKTFSSLLIGLFSVVFVIVIGFFIFRESGIKDLWKVSGLLIGVYTGGTPNLASLKMMLDVDANTYILTHTYDLIVGVFYLSFLLSVGHRFFNKYLTKFPLPTGQFELQENEEKENFWGFLNKKTLFQLGKALLVAIGILSIGGGLSLMVPENLLMVVVILSITTLGILASLIPAINRVEKSFDAGMYLILIFSLVVASMADIRNFEGLTPALLGYISLAVFGSLTVHVLLSKIFKIDADTTMITSVAFICSPPFVPVIAGALRNRQIMVSGITIGIIGYAIGNYLGFLVANILKMF
ncbi:DUF819 family protein [Aquiflexum lacus]|uniref:DUF819 family protein n=1 Tax=Aquiflexum lacus TaxID=2483805 RepID=UPI001894EA8B|nr:DUF819 family protein [Aquiflexum lacus]